MMQRLVAMNCCDVETIRWVHCHEPTFCLVEENFETTLLYCVKPVENVLNLKWCQHCWTYCHPSTNWVKPTLQTVWWTYCETVNDYGKPNVIQNPAAQPIVTKTLTWLNNNNNMVECHDIEIHSLLTKINLNKF